jgi:3-oxoacyl-[acyl-carrier-protein] synthase II
MIKRRVVVTGLGIVAPNGIGKEAFWQANVKGLSGVSLIKHFDTSALPSKIAASIYDFDPAQFMAPAVVRRTDRFVHLGVAAARLALLDSGLNLGSEDPKRIGCIIGSGLGGVLFHEDQIKRGFEKGLDRLSPQCVPRITPNAVSGHIAIEFGLRGSNMTISAACASGTIALGEAFRKIQAGGIELAFAGGAEAPLTRFTFAAYCSLRALSRRNDAPQEASRPFDKDRDGMVLGEGAAILILEELSHALNRGAPIYAEVAGYGNNSGAYNMVMPVEDGSDVAQAMREAVQDAGLDLKDIHYINAHGTATQAGDQAETRAIKALFGEYARAIPISSTKSMIGHTIGAAGAIEAGVCCLAIQSGIIPPTINYRTRDPECDLDYVPNQARAARVKNVLSNSFGFGSCNACLALKRPG